MAMVERNNVDCDKRLLKVEASVTNFDDIKDCLPNDMPEKYHLLAKIWFEFQLMLKNRDLGKAKEIASEHFETKDWKDFEYSNPKLLAAIDLMVRGTTNMVKKDTDASFKFNKIISKPPIDDSYRR